MNNKDFFIKYGSKKICYRNDGSVWSDESFTPELLAQAIEDRIMEKEEEQYQRFKARLINEVMVDIKLHTYSADSSKRQTKMYEWSGALVEQADLVEKE